MKTVLSLFAFLFLCAGTTMAQVDHNSDGSGKVLVDNDKVEVVEYIGNPKDNVCGIGSHYHDAHLTIALSDAKVLITPEEGKQQTVDILSGTAIWFEEGIHSATNEGNEATKFLLVYLKE